MSPYIRKLIVRYDDSTGAIPGGDINKGFGRGTADVYLVPEYTDDVNLAAHGFAVVTTNRSDLNAADISKGDWRTYFRYIETFYRNHDPSVPPRVVASAWLDRTPDSQDGDDRTADLNKSRGGDYLYLCWSYARPRYGDGATMVDISNGSEFEARREAELTRVRTEIPTAEDTFKAFRDANLGEGGTRQPGHAPAECIDIRTTIENIVFSQSSISSEFRNGEELATAIDVLRKASVPDRVALLEVFPLIQVVQLPFAGTQPFITLDNRRLQLMRSVLPPGTEITVQLVKDADAAASELRRKWTSKDSELYIKVRSTLASGPGPLLGTAGFADGDLAPPG